jgi:hypothetical protein
MDKWLLTPAAGDDDEDEGMTKEDLFHMLAEELGYSVTATIRNPKHPNYNPNRKPKKGRQ